MRRVLVPALLLSLFATGAARAADRGRLMGTVLARGVPQLGAVVLVTPDDRPGSPVQLITDRAGRFLTQPLPVGRYAIHVRLAGFLPAYEPAVSVTPGRVTMPRIELGSVFSSVELLRRGPQREPGKDEWSWVLRSATVARPVLRYASTTAEDSPGKPRSRGRVELTAGSLRPWSPADPDPQNATAFLYDQPVEGGHLLLAGRLGYEHSASGGFAATWTPRSGSFGAEATTIVFRQAVAGSLPAPVRGFRIAQVRRTQLSETTELEYGAEYLVATFNGSTTAIRPMLGLRIQARPGWAIGVLMLPSGTADPDSGPLEQLDEFPTVLRSAGRVALDRGWHEEIQLARERRGKDRLLLAVFGETAAHTAVYGLGTWDGPNVLTDPYSTAFVYDAGRQTRWGTRVSYRRQLGEHWQASAVGGWARGLARARSLPVQGQMLPLEAEGQWTLGARVEGQIPRWGTELVAGYQWIPASAVIRPDPFGDHLAELDPFLSLSVRQPLPSFLCCRLIALADVRNLLAQGYTRLDLGGREILLVPLARSFRGGLAVQF